MSLLALALAGGLVLSVPTLDPASGVAIQLSSAFRESPAAGFLPVLAEIRNDTGRSGTWTFRFSSDAGGLTTSRFVLAVESGGIRREELMVPLGNGCSAHGMCQANVSLAMAGPGVTGSAVTVAWRRLPAPLPPFAMSEAVAQRFWQELETAAGSSNTLAGSRFDPAHLPSDWRAWVFFERVFLTRSEWTSLAPGPRQALRAWVARGGRLLLTDADASDAPLGLGRMIGLGGAPEAVPQWALAPSETLFREQAEDRGGFLRRVPAVTVESGPVALFMLLFALLVGPLNLFVLCRGPRRPLLFWTVPAFSLGASVLLAAFILLKDGTGGRGERFTTVVLLPEDHLAVVLQEQAARTGVLLGQSFETREPLLVVPLGRREGGLRFEGPRLGGLFASRTRQGHYLETLRPGRARLSLLQTEAGLDAVSSLPGPLAELFVLDEAGKPWQAKDVAPGRRVSLQATTPARGATLLPLAMAGPRSSVLLRELLDRPQPGTFLARGTRGAAIETLPGIDWSDTVVYQGAVSPP